MNGLMNLPESVKTRKTCTPEKICTFLFLLQERGVTEQLGAAKLMH